MGRGRGGVRLFKCATQPCTEVWRVRYDSQRQLKEMNDSNFYKGWKCSRHSNPKRFLTPDNPANHVTLECQLLKPGEPQDRYNSPTWREVFPNAKDGGSSFNYSDAHVARAEEFPLGTRLHITVYTETPEQAAVAAAIDAEEQADAAAE